MKHKLTEENILNKIYSLSHEGKNILAGPGDDCAVIKLNANKALVITTDGLVQGTHFITHKNNAKNLAKKLLAVNLSDMSAMGNVLPIGAVCAAGLPKNISPKWVDTFTKELFAQAKKFKLPVIGGNISKSKTLHLYLTVFGTVNPKKIIKRSTAISGNLIYGIGNLGHGKAGLEIIKNRSKKFKSLAADFWQPKNCQKQSQILSKHNLATAMIDNSDGLYESIKIVSCQSGLGGKIKIDKKAVSAGLKKYCRHFNKNPADYIMYGGDDYGLIFTVKPSNEKKLLKFLPKAYKLGRITKTKKVTSEFKKEKTFSHF
jgi:thiamine-monophosphate kinase